MLFIKLHIVPLPSRPQWMALCIPPDLILTVLEGITAIIHYCLLDPTSQYHQVRAPRTNKSLKIALSFLSDFFTASAQTCFYREILQAGLLLLHLSLIFIEQTVSGVSYSYTEVQFK